MLSTSTALIPASATSRRPSGSPFRHALPVLLLSKLAHVLAALLACAHLAPRSLDPAWAVLHAPGVEMGRVEEAAEALREAARPPPMAVYVFLVLASAAGVACVLQRPWNGKKITSRKSQRLLSSGLLVLTSLFFYLIGIHLCGPFRAMVLEGAELPLAYLYLLSTQRERHRPRKTLGTLLILAAYLCIMWDGAADRRGKIAGKLTTPIGETELGRVAGARLKALGARAKGVARGEAERVREMVAAKRRKREAALDAASISEELVDDDVIPGSRGRAARRRLLWDDDDVGPRLMGAGARRRLMRDDEDGGGDGEPDVGLSENYEDSAAWNEKDDDSDVDFDEPDADEDFLAEIREETPLPEYNMHPGSDKSVPVGVLFVLASLAITQLSRGFTRRVAEDVGGPKRQFALSLVVACALSAPLALSAAFRRRGMLSLLTFSLLAKPTAVGVLLVLVPFYLKSFATRQLDQRTVVRAAQVVPFLLVVPIAAVLGRRWTALGGAGGVVGVSALLVVSFGIACAGLALMTGGGDAQRREEDEAQQNK